MEPRRCPTCGTPGPHDAKFCSGCGASFDATFIDLTAEQEPQEQSQVVRTGASRVFVPLAALGLLALAGVLLFSGGDDTPADQAGVAEIDGPNARPTEAPAPTATDRPQPTPRATPSPDPTNVPVDPAALPATDATHLAIAFDSTVAFLDLRTGLWIERDAGARLAMWAQGPFFSGSLAPFGDGIIAATEAGGAVHVPVSGVVERIAEDYGYWLGVSDGLVFVQGPGEDVGAAVGPSIRAIGADGSTAFELDLPPMAWPAGLTGDGRVLTQGGSGVYAIGQGSVTRVASGQFVGGVGNSLLIRDCDAELRCTTNIVNLDTGDLRSLDIPPGFINSVGADIVSVCCDSDSGDRFFRLEGGDLRDITDEMVNGNRLGALARAEDASGVAALLVQDGTHHSVTFTDRAGNGLASVPFARPGGRCCGGDLAMTFVTLNSSAS